MARTPISAAVFVTLAIFFASAAANGQAHPSASGVPHVEDPPTGQAPYPPPTSVQKMASCMALWQADTHMTKAEWKSVCKRVETRN